jgi:hypothetical protein
MPHRSAPWRLAPLALLALGLQAAAPPAAADPATPPQLAPSRSAEALSAIARIRRGAAQTGGCSAVLITPDRALTAAHCAAGPMRLMNPYMLTFGPWEDPPRYRVRVTGVTLHAGYNPDERRLEALGTDLALLTLEAPVPPEVATPIPLAEGFGLPPERAAIYGYVNGATRDILHGHPVCQIGPIRPGVIGSDCTVVSGFSGTPVISGDMADPATWRVEGIAVATVDNPPLRAIIADVAPWPDFPDTPRPGTPAAAPTPTGGKAP